MGQWNGQWKVLVGGQEVYRFGGVGNSQADANRIAAAWLRQNGQGVSGEGFEVYPVMAESLREYRMPQPSHGPGAIKDLNEPLGPETPPKMPDGTIKVDVSDMYDWYKLGQKISDLNSIKPGELGQGPPSTVFAFGSEDLENMYSHELTRLGLKTHDLDEPGEEDIDESQLDEDIENFPIANVRRPNGAIGAQGVNTEQAADVLTHAAGMQVSPDWTMRQMVDALKADPAAQQRLRQFVQQNPVTVYALPDGSYHLQDGHHRTFLLNLLGDETVPAIVKEDVKEANTVEFEGLTLKVIKQGHELVVDALDDWGNKVLGHVKFNIGDGRELDPQDLHVDDKYQGQGIARVMYDYVKSLGYTIVRSWDQTDAGAGFWNKHRGEDVRVWEQGVAENFADGKNPGRKGLSKRVGVNTKASVSDLRKTAKNSSGEKQRMAHWLANMKAGRAKARRK
jgi:ribosomal protein S18 acetylase RimI-like enzyme